MEKYDRSSLNKESLCSIIHKYFVAVRQLISGYKIG